MTTHSKQHPSTPKPSTPNRKESIMTTKTAPSFTLPGAPLPTPTATTVTQTTAPPSFAIPATPPVPPNLAPARGVLPWAAQIAAVPAVLLELKGNTSFEATFVPLVPSASTFATDLANAAGWTAYRQALVAYLLYVKSQEVIMWRQAKSDMEALGVFFQGVAAHNPRLLDELPALARLLDVTKQGGQRGAATRAATAKANAAHKAAVAPPATGATAAPVVNPVIPTTQNAPIVAVSGEGGAGH